MRVFPLFISCKPDKIFVESPANGVSVLVATMTEWVKTRIGDNTEPNAVHLMARTMAPCHASLPPLVENAPENPFQVTSKTQALHATCESLLTEQHRLEAQVKALSYPLEHFGALDELGPALGLPFAGSSRGGQSLPPGVGVVGGVVAMPGVGAGTLRRTSSGIGGGRALLRPGSDAFAAVRILSYIYIHTYICTALLTRICLLGCWRCSRQALFDVHGSCYAEITAISLVR